MASSSQERKYDVFVSFRGEDTYKIFVSDLYTSLRSKGIFAFKDEERPISPAKLFNAIEESRFAIIIFSESYGSSTRCLEELTKIMECVRYKDQIPIPVFYGVSPSNVRNQTNKFGESFGNHMENLKGTVDLQKVKMWTEALTQAASISGWDVRNTALFRKFVPESARRTAEGYFVPESAGLIAQGYFVPESARGTADGYGNESDCIRLMVDQIFYSSDHPVSAAQKNLVGILEPPVAVGSGGVCSGVDSWVERKF